MIMLIRFCFIVLLIVRLMSSCPPKTPTTSQVVPKSLLITWQLFSAFWRYIESLPWGIAEKFKFPAGLTLKSYSRLALLLLQTIQVFPNTNTSNTNFFPFCPNKQRLMLLTYRWRPTWPKDRDRQRMQSNHGQASSHSRLFPIFPYNENYGVFFRYVFT